MKYILFIFLALFTITGCNTQSDSSFDEQRSSTDISIKCVTSPSSSDIDSYITLNSGDTIVKQSDDTSISIYHDTDGNKKVCLVSGSAYIISNS